MRLKSFHARTMTEAMQMVREALGEEAIIVATQEEPGGKGVRVTAAIDPADYNEPNEANGIAPRDHHTAARTPHHDDWLQYDEEDEDSAVAEEITDAMLRHNLPEDVMDHIISCATVIGLDHPGIALIAALEHLFDFTPLPTGSSPKPIMLVGPPGAGKTLSIAKIATQGIMNDLNIGVITTDTVRAGGVEQLQAFTNVLDIPLHTARTPQDLHNTISRLSACDQIIIDTAGTNPFARPDVQVLSAFTTALPVDLHLVLPAGGDAAECGEMAQAYAAMGVRKILPTRIDLARRLGGLLSAAHHGGLKFSAGTNTPKVAEGLFSLTPKTLAKLLMPQAYSDDDKQPLRRTARPALKKTGT